jgi:uncharacterized sporulation protein YeaH/YhbH (DUF444 family)
MRSGGTVISPAFAFVHKLIRERFDASKTNLYLSYAGDGDNWGDDNSKMEDVLVGSGLLGKLRHASYAQVGDGEYGGAEEFWEVLDEIAGRGRSRDGRRKLAMVKIEDESEVIEKFHEIYRKEKA